MTTDIEPARDLTADDLDAIIATKVEVDQAFWRALSTVRRGGQVSANEISRRVHAAGIASRPTVLNRLRAMALAESSEEFRDMAAKMHSAGQAFERLRASVAVMRKPHDESQ